MNTLASKLSAATGAGPAAEPGTQPSAPAAACPPSIGARLSWALAALTLFGLLLVSGVIYSATAMRIHSAQADTLADKTKILSEFVRVSCTEGEGYLLYKLSMLDPMRQGTALELRRGNGTLLFRDDPQRDFRHSIGRDFVVPAELIAGGSVTGRLELDVSHDARMLGGLAVTLVLSSLGGAALSGLAIRALVRRQLRPLQLLAAQTRAISAQRLHQRLQLDRPVEELQPWIEQFNALMQRLERAYAQLEGFNADVAHELRTPLANLIGQTELALARERSPDELRDTLVSNLEEMQRLAAMVNDMLFLSQADRGAQARRGQPVALADLAAQVAEFHEATAEEAGLSLHIDGDARVAVDEPLVKRALSNLLGNATRFAEAGSVVVVKIEPVPGGGAELTVHNRGEGVPPEALPRLFDRFYRADESRSCCDMQHHGLGLAIVAAIARMHGGQPMAASADGYTRVGLSLAAG